MADDQHIIEIQLHANLVDINSALDGRHKIRFMLLCKKRRDLQAKLDRVLRAVALTPGG
jgi:hypothetical protein